jgi:hypothetical protein
MAKLGRYGKPRNGRPIQKQRGTAPAVRGRDIPRREERLRIAPKHPGMGRK